MTFVRRSSVAAIAAVTMLSLAACSGSTETEQSAKAMSGTESGVSAMSGDADKAPVGPEITVISHDSFDFPQELLDKFKNETGITVKLQPMGDGGTVANQLVLTKDAPLGDVVYGVDNTVSFRLAGQNVIADAGVASPDASLDFAAVPGLVPIDQGDVCVNVDKKWFADKNLTLPSSFEDFAKPEYKDMLVALNPTSSTPGMAFMLATINHFGDEGWLDYWKNLKANGAKVAEGWSDAFKVDYSSGEGAGSFPMMVSYGSSPAFFVNDEKTESSNAALMSTCYRQVEYAGVLEGSKHTDAAKKFIEFMLTKEVQEEISNVTYMHPVTAEAKASEDLLKFGPLTESPILLPADKVAQNSEKWLKEWQEAVNG